MGRGRSTRSATEGDRLIEIGWDPNIHLGPVTLAWHGIFTAVGIFFGVWLPVRLLDGVVSEDDGYAIGTWGVVCGVIGARLVHVADRWAFYAEDPLRILQVWTGGIAIWGGVLGGIVGGYAVALIRRVPIGRTADAAACGLGLGLAIGRIGDIINGEHHAVACAGLPWCVGYSFPPELGGLGQPGPVHPAVAYEMVVVFALVGLCLWGRRLESLAPGTLFWIFLLCYGVIRFTISFLRVDDPTPFLGLRQDQLIGLGAMIASAPMLALRLARSRPR